MQKYSDEQWCREISDIVLGGEGVGTFQRNHFPTASQQQNLAGVGRSNIKKGQVCGDKHERSNSDMSVTNVKTKPLESTVG